MILTHSLKQVLKKFNKKYFASLIRYLFDGIFSLLNNTSGLNWLSPYLVWKRFFVIEDRRHLSLSLFLGNVAECVACFVLFCFDFSPKWLPCLDRLIPLEWTIGGNVFLSFAPFLTGVIAVVIFIIFSIIGIMTRFLYQHKQSHRTNQIKEKEYPENLDSSFRNDIDLQNTVSECKREYFIWKTAGSPNTLVVLLKFFSFSFSCLLILVILFLLLVCHLFLEHTCLCHSVYPLDPAPKTRQLWPLSSSLTNLSWWQWSLSRLTWLIQTRKRHVCIFSSAFLASKMHSSVLQSFGLAGLPWTWALWLKHRTAVLDVLPHLKSIPTRALRVEEEDTRGLVSFSGILKGTKEVCLVFIFLTIGSPLP